MPVVSIILPTYNRAKFLPDALACITTQTFTDWELIIVDDGSVDDTRRVVDQFAAQTSNPVRYIYQENQGCGAARNRGVDEAGGQFIAFFDSDDVVRNYHLKDCVDVLTRHPEVDWVYADTNNVDARTGRVLSESIFREKGRDREFTRLRSRSEGKLHIFDDPGVLLCSINHGIWAKLQASLLRRSVFDKVRVPPFRLADDVAFELMALGAGVRAAYIDNVHIEYQLHEGGASTPLGLSDLGQRIDKFKGTYQALEYAYQHAHMKGREDSAMRHRLANMQFLSLGYAMHWMNGQPREAFVAFRRAIGLYPWDPRFWKTYLATRAKHILGAAPRPNSAAPPQGTHSP